MGQIISLTNDIFVLQLESGRGKMVERGGIYNIKDELQTKISDMRRKMKSLSSMDRKME